MSAYNGNRRGSGPKKKYDIHVPQGQRTTTISIELNVYARGDVQSKLALVSGPTTT